MGTKAYTVETIELQGFNDENGDPVQITVHPLVIAKFRKLANILDALTNPKENDEKTVIEVLLEAVAFCMQTFEPRLGKPRELEKYASVPDLEFVLDIVAGVKFNDPNLAAAMAATSGKV